jgi:acylphosphatase
VDEAIRAVARGRVQGVGFRDFVETRARSLHLAGYVRNMDDGSVEVVAEGPRPALEQLIAYLHDGPRGAYVRAIAVEWGEAAGTYRDFGVEF